MKIKKGDKVKIMLGKDRGKEGTVEYVIPKKGKVIVGGVNVYKRHIKKMGETKGGIIDIAKPLNVSNVVLICSSCHKPTRIGYKFEGDSKLRICKKCKKEINYAKA